MRLPTKLLQEQPWVRQRDGKSLPDLEALGHRILEGLPGVQL